MPTRTECEKRAQNASDDADDETRRNDSQSEAYHALGQEKDGRLLVLKGSVRIVRDKHGGRATCALTH
jgi:hypothetical protein